MGRSALQLECLWEVFKKPGSFVLAFATALGLVLMFLWLPNWHLIVMTMGSETLELAEKMRIVATLLGSLESNFTVWSRWNLLTVAVLSGIQLALTSLYVERVTKARRSFGTPLVSIVIGILGVGCASCGSIILTTILGLGVSTALLGFLPFHGQELSVLGIFVLLITIWFTTRRMTAPEICKL